MHLGRLYNAKNNYAFNKIAFFTLVSIFIFLTPHQIQAKCAFENKTPIKVLFPTGFLWKKIGFAMQECRNIVVEQDNEKQKQLSFHLKNSPNKYSIATADTLSILPLIEGKHIRPLDDLVQLYGENLNNMQLIRYEGKIMAIAITANTQHFMYRQDIFDELDIDEPQTYNDVLLAAKKITKKKGYTFPLGGAYKTGWHVGLEFVNIYLSLDGELWDEEGLPTVNNGTARKTLSLMQRLGKYMGDDYLKNDDVDTINKLQKNQAVMAHLWVSYAEATDDLEKSKVVGKITMRASPSGKKEDSPCRNLMVGRVCDSK